MCKSQDTPPTLQSTHNLSIMQEEQMDITSMGIVIKLKMGYLEDLFEVPYEKKWDWSIKGATANTEA